jgi:hypothetical protein
MLVRPAPTVKLTVRDASERSSYCIVFLCRRVFLCPAQSISARTKRGAFFRHLVKRHRGLPACSLLYQLRGVPVGAAVDSLRCPRGSRCVGRCRQRWVLEPDSELLRARVRKWHAKSGRERGGDAVVSVTAARPGDGDSPDWGAVRRDARRRRGTDARSPLRVAFCVSRGRPLLPHRGGVDCRGVLRPPAQSAHLTEQDRLTCLSLWLQTA